jgi:chemotaxis signal transduction protein/hemoglobin-like flavoprotein
VKTQQTGTRQLVVTTVNDTFFGIDIEDVHEIIPVPEIRAVPKAPANLLGVIDVRGVVIPVADLRACLGFSPRPFTPETRIVLVNHRDEKIGLVVDAVNEVTTLAGDAFESMADGHGDSPFVRAVARFQDQLVLEIDHDRAVDDNLDVWVPPLVVEEPAIAAEEPEPEPEAPHPSLEDGGPIHTELVELSYQLIASKADAVASRFFKRLFEEAPATRELFPADLTDQKRALMAALGTIVGHLDAPDMLQAYVSGLGQRHAAYGATPAHFDVFAATLIEAMAHVAGKRWTDGYTAAWRRALAHVRTLMFESQPAAAIPVAATRPTPARRP